MRKIFLQSYTPAAQNRMTPGMCRKMQLAELRRLYDSVNKGNRRKEIKEKQEMPKIKQNENRRIIK